MDFEKTKNGAIQGETKILDFFNKFLHATSLEIWRNEILSLSLHRQCISNLN